MALHDSHAALPQVIDTEGLARLLQRTPSGIYTTLCRRPECLPPPAHRARRGQKLLWLLDDVLAWMRSADAPATIRAIAPEPGPGQQQAGKGGNHV